jgi:hypothetical protein
MPHIAAVHSGAAIEALQRSYAKRNKEISNARLLKADDWKRIKASMERGISELGVDEAIKGILNNKLNDFNTIPPTLITKEVFKLLQVALGERESAWQRKNDAAHGNDVETQDLPDLIKDLMILRLRFHRLLLSITKASDFYYDYFSLGHPVKRLGEPIA